MNSNTLNLAQAEENFQLFLFELDDRQEDFIIAAEVKLFALDYSLKSLPELERYVKEAQLNWEDKADAAVGQRLDCWTYLGEVMRQNHGGAWQLSWNDDNTANRGQYVIAGHTATAGIEFTPLRLIRAFSQRGKGGELIRAVQAQINPVRIDLSDLHD